MRLLLLALQHDYGAGVNGRKPLVTLVVCATAFHRSKHLHHIALIDITQLVDTAVAKERDSNIVRIIASSRDNNVSLAPDTCNSLSLNKGANLLNFSDNFHN